MKNFKPNKKFIKILSQQIGILIKDLEDEIILLNSKDEDLFLRYMTFHRLATLIQTVNLTQDVFRSSLAIGHAICSPLLQTEMAKESGWSKIRLSNNPFFMEEGENDPSEFKVSDLNLDKNLQ